MEVLKKASGCKGHHRPNISIHGRFNFCQECLQSNPERNRCLLYPAATSKNKNQGIKKKKWSTNDLKNPSSHHSCTMYSLTFSHLSQERYRKCSLTAAYVSRFFKSMLLCPRQMDYSCYKAGLNVACIYIDLCFLIQYQRTVQNCRYISDSKVNWRTQLLYAYFYTSITSTHFMKCYQKENK